MCSSAYNFSHRIDKLLFGPEVPGLISPLDGDIAKTEKSKSCVLAVWELSIRQSDLLASSHNTSICTCTCSGFFFCLLSFVVCAMIMVGLYIVLLLQTRRPYFNIG